MFAAKDNTHPQPHPNPVSRTCNGWYRRFLIYAPNSITYNLPTKICSHAVKPTSTNSTVTFHHSLTDDRDYHAWSTVRHWKSTISYSMHTSSKMYTTENRLFNTVCIPQAKFHISPDGLYISQPGASPRFYKSTPLVFKVSTNIYQVLKL
jgi:hypothetical protein